MRSLSFLARIARWPGNLWRIFVVGCVATICLLSYLLLRIGAFGIFPKARRVSWLARVRGRLLRWFVTAAGATFIKLGQVMSTRPDLFRPETIAELRKLQDKLPGFSFRKVRRIVEAELGAPIEEHYKEFDTHALAAASVAQVHRARLVDGSEVAVKVLRPAVERHVKRDGAILMFFARISNLHPRVRLSAPIEHMKEFVDAIAAQTSLKAEAANYERFHNNFADLEDIHFPTVHPELCADRVLTMEFIHGRKIDDLGPGSHVATAKLTRKAFFKMCFEDGFVHADLHPGNMLVNDKGHLIIFDVGMVKLITDEVKLQFVDFAKCVSMGTPDDFVEHLRRFHTYMEDVDWEAVERDSNELVKKFRDQNAANLEMGKFANDIFALAREHGIQPLPELMVILVGVITAEGISKMLDPDVQSFQEMATFLMPVIARLGLINKPATTA
jgi:ubiquinone biosynthesis protein